MPGGKGNIRPSDNPKPFKLGNSGNPYGSPPSLKKQIQEILIADGQMKIDAKNVISVHEDGSVEIRLPKKEMVAMKLFQWAMSNRPAASIRAIELMFNYIDGKPHQSIDIDMAEPIQQIELSDEQFAEVMKEITPHKSNSIEIKSL